MAKTFVAPFTQHIKTNTLMTSAATANINTDAPTNTYQLIAAGTEGTLVTSLSAIPRATLTDNSLLAFVSRDDGTVKRLVSSAQMKAHTLSATAAIPVTRFAEITAETPLRLMPGETLWVGMQVAVAGGVVFRAEGMDY